MGLPILLIIKMMLTIILLGLIRLLIRVCDALILKPRRLRSKLRKQGIRGPPPSFLLGNILEMKKAQSQVPKPQQGEEVAVHNSSSLLFPALEQWSQQYGPTFMFSIGNLQYLHMNDPRVVKEISITTSLDFGKPSYQQKLLGPLLGQGVLTSNGTNWAHQRKILSPEFTCDSVKGMRNLMVESAIRLVDSWTKLIESEGGVAEIEIDNYLNSFSADVISRACFGSTYSIGKDIFLKLRRLQENMNNRSRYIGISIFRYLPTKSNREARRLQNEIRELILNVVKERKEATKPQNDLLQMILEGAENSKLGKDSMERVIVDNCKNIYLAGYETTAVSSAWTLMLLASNQEWQARARAEVLEICRGQLPDAEMVRKMKTLIMVIHESLRLYPPVPMISREAFQDLQFGDIHVPKGVNIWTMLVTLQQDPNIWGPDAHMFNPQRFANGVSGSCKLPHVYMPFGVGPRVCLGRNFAMVELKILLALILSNFSFTLSPNYRHLPVQKLVMKPGYGVNVVIRKL